MPSVIRRYGQSRDYCVVTLTLKRIDHRVRLVEIDVPSHFLGENSQWIEEYANESVLIYPRLS